MLTVFINNAFFYKYKMNSTYHNQRYISYDIQHHWSHVFGVVLIFRWSLWFFQTYSKPWNTIFYSKRYYLCEQDVNNDLCYFAYLSELEKRGIVKCMQSITVEAWTKWSKFYKPHIQMFFIEEICLHLIPIPRKKEFTSGTMDKRWALIQVIQFCIFYRRFICWSVAIIYLPWC